MYTYIYISVKPSKSGSCCTELPDSCAVKKYASCFEPIRLSGINGREKIRVDEWKIVSR